MKPLPQIIALGYIGKGTIERLLPAAHPRFHVAKQLRGGRIVPSIEQLAPFTSRHCGNLIPGVALLPDERASIQCDDVIFRSFSSRNERDNP